MSIGFLTVLVLLAVLVGSVAVTAYLLVQQRYNLTSGALAAFEELMHQFKQSPTEVAILNESLAQGETYFRGVASMTRKEIDARGSALGHMTKYLLQTSPSRHTIEEKLGMLSVLRDESVISDEKYHELRNELIRNT